MGPEGGGNRDQSKLVGGISLGWRKCSKTDPFIVMVAQLAKSTKNCGIAHSKWVSYMRSKICLNKVEIKGRDH